MRINVRDSLLTLLTKIFLKELRYLKELKNSDKNCEKRFQPNAIGVGVENPVAIAFGFAAHNIQRWLQILSLRLDSHQVLRSRLFCFANDFGECKTKNAPAEIFRFIFLNEKYKLFELGSQAFSNCFGTGCSGAAALICQPNLQL